MKVRVYILFGNNVDEPNAIKPLATELERDAIEGVAAQGLLQAAAQFLNAVGPGGRVSLLFNRGDADHELTASVTITSPSKERMALDYFVECRETDRVPA